MTSFVDRTHSAAPDDISFRTVFEQSPISTQIFAPSGETIAVNRAWERLWGVRLEQIAPYNVLQDPQLEEKGIMPYIQQAFAGEAAEIPAIKYEPNRTMAVPGAVRFRWVRASIYPVKNQDGSIREVVLMHEDITEQQRAEDALAESEARFRAVFQSAPVGIALVDPEGRYLAVNPARQQMLGRTEEELLGKRYIDLTHPEDIEHDVQINAEARATGRERFQLEKRFIRADGETGWVRITAALVRDESGEERYAVSVAEDITARKRTEEERARLFELEREARARVERLAAEQSAILRQVAEGIIITDPLGYISFVNRRAAEIHGVRELGVPVERYSEVYHLYTMDGEPYPPEDLPLTRAVLGGETVVDAEWRILRPDGSEIVAQGSAAPVLGDDGTRLGAVLTIRDVTEQYNLERQKDEFLSALAHDLRTPLTTIKGRSQILRARAERGVLDDEALLDSLRRIDTNATRIITLINELLDVANLQIGRQVELALRPTDLVALARDVAAEHHQSSEKHTIVVEAEPAEIVGSWDPVRLERVFANLLSNALKYSPGGGEIRIELSQEDDAGGSWAVVSITDRGVGIPAQDLPSIFERFRRGRNVAGAIAGTGIGLAAVRAIVEQHGGRITAESEEGKGSTFTVRLPLSP